jgi:hypothetical protein
MNDFINTLGTHHVETVYFLLFLLFVFVCLFFLASVKNDTDAHTPRHRKAKEARFEEEVRKLDRHHGEIEHRRSVIHSLKEEKRRGR